MEDLTQPHADTEVPNETTRTNEAPLAPAHGLAFTAEITTEWDNRFGIAAQLEEIARQLRRGVHMGLGSGSGGSHKWSISPNDQAQRPALGGKDKRE